MSKSFGFQKLAEQVAEFLLSEWEWQSEEAGQMIGDSKIEKLLFSALTIECEIGASEFNEVMLARSEEEVIRLMAERHPWSIRLVVWPQAPVENRRVDFLIYSQDWEAAPGVLRKLIVECDGHDFHERTKEQVARDRAKDRRAVMSGIDCFRFTGSEIWRDPWECAQQILEWANKGFGT